MNRRGLVLCLLLAAGLPRALRALEFEMQTQMKCMYEEINANVLVVGDYKVFNRDHPTIQEYVDVRVSAMPLPLLSLPCTRHDRCSEA